MRRHLVLADIERAEHRGLGGALALPVVDGIDQHRHANHVGKQDELLPDRGALLACPGQEIDRIFPLLEGEIGLANIVVQRLHQFLQQEFGARIRRIVETADHGGGQFGFAKLAHFSVLRDRRRLAAAYTSAPPGVSAAGWNGAHFSAIKAASASRNRPDVSPTPPRPKPPECPKRRSIASKIT